jgi:hypothetical protein
MLIDHPVGFAMPGCIKENEGLMERPKVQDGLVIS